MQYHYVVGFDSELNRWFIEYDTTAYFSDGNIWDEKRAEDRDWGYTGWMIPEEGSPEEELDYKLLGILESCIPDIMPSPTVEV